MEEEYLIQQGRTDIIELKDETVDGSKRIYTKEELLQKSKEINAYLNELGLPNSKWSGKTFVKTKVDMPTSTGTKKKICDIWLREDAGIKTIIHEHLHARSSSWMEKRFRKDRGYEEGACELLAEEICKRNNISYKPSYKEYVEPLREFNRISGKFSDDYEFAIEFFEVDMDKREEWLLEIAKEYNFVKASVLKRLVKKVRT